MNARLVLCLSVLVVFGRPGYGLMEENFGPGSIGDYAKIPGLAEVVNQPSRIYQWWVNGNEHFYYQADPQQLNAILKEFSEIEAEPLEVVLRPGRGEVESCEVYDKTYSEIVTHSKKIAYNADLHIVQGLARRSFGERPPLLTIFIDNSILLETLQFPIGVSVLAPSMFRAGLIKKLRSEDEEERGRAAFELAETEPYTADNVPLIAALLEDEAEWVRSMAAGSLGQLGAHALSTLPEIRAAKELTSRKEYIQTAIDGIEGAPPALELTEKERGILNAIEAYCLQNEVAESSG